MALTREERTAFLAEPHIAALSVAAGPERGPLTVPIWYGYEPGGEPWILTPAASRKAELIQAVSRFTLMAQRIAPTVRYVAVEGPVTVVRPGTEDDIRRIAGRYLAPESAAAYVRMALAEHGPQVLIALRPAAWLSADLGSAS